MPAEQPRIIARVFAYLHRYPLLAAATLLCALGSSVMVIVFPVVTQRIVDDVLRGGKAEALWPMIALAAFGFLAQDGLNTLRILLNNTFEQKVLFDLRSDLYAAVAALTNRIARSTPATVTPVERVAAWESAHADGLGRAAGVRARTDGYRGVLLGAGRSAALRGAAVV